MYIARSLQLKTFEKKFKKKFGNIKNVCTFVPLQTTNGKSAVSQLGKKYFKNFLKKACTIGTTFVPLFQQQTENYEKILQLFH